MAGYKLTRDGIIIRISDSKVITPAPIFDVETPAGDPDWLEYEAWINEGNQPAIEPNVTVLPQDLLAQFTVSDIAAIQTAIAADAAKALLWYSLLAQRDPMAVANERFTGGWAILVSILGAPRMAAIAAAMGVEIGS